MKKIHSVMTSAFVFLLIAGCGPKPPVVPRPSEEEAQPETKALPEPGPVDSSGLFSEGFSSVRSVAYSPLEGKPESLVIPGSTHYAAHDKYSGETPSFAPLPEAQLPRGGQVVVVGSDVARFYPNAKVSGQADLTRLGKGTPIPIGTLIAVGDPIRSADGDYEGLFEFEANYNFFYPTTYGGVKGLVFGADLYGLDGNLERNTLAALRYRTKGRYESFYPVYGLYGIDDGLKASLESNRLDFERVTPGSYQLSVEQPDDMISLYENTASDPQNCIFITTDLFSHSLHLVFDHYLQMIEEEFFSHTLALLIDSYLSKIDALIAADEKTTASYTKTLALARLYFEVPRAILDAAPDRAMDDYGRPGYADKDKVQIYRQYSAAAQEILGFMDAHAGFETIPEFLYKEDFSQYKPRGHYTKNGILSAYFQAMMWFGRVHMYVADADPPPFVWTDGNAKASATELSLLLTPVAVLLNDMTKKDPGLLASWRSLYDPITYLIGLSDDLSFDDVMPFIERERIKDFRAWTADEKAIIAMVKKANSTLRAPLIAGNSVMFVPSGEDQNPPMGWRLFGQRFTYDSAVHMATSSPRMMGRDWVSGLDIMKAFGSKTADSLLETWDNGYVEFPLLRTTLDKFESEFSGYDPQFWGRTYYNRTLFLIKSQTQMERGAGFYFTETPLWNTKALLSAHGTWAELRHDTILYAKQPYGAEMGGEGYEPTYRTRPVPPPIHYIEPNLPFFTGARLLVRDLYEKMAKAGLMTEDYAGALESLDWILGKATAIIHEEVEDKPISEEDNGFIASIPQKLAPVVSPSQYGQEYSEDTDQLKMAVVADVYTAVAPGKVLEVAVGIPYRLNLLLSDGQGGKRIAAGYTYSYYEFTHPMDDRMTDEQWKKIVYDPGAKLSEYEPFWAKDLTE
jgi:hypothetical protein